MSLRRFNSITASIRYTDHPPPADFLDRFHSELLQSFDIVLCKASFDGRLFRVPQPHLSFCAETALDPQRQKLMRTFVAETFSEGPEPLWAGFNVYGYSGLEVDVRRQRVAAFRARVVPLLMSAGLRGNTLDLILEWSDLGLNGSKDDETFMRKFHHNFIVRLLKRYAKYRGRGIGFMGVSPGKRIWPSALPPKTSGLLKFSTGVRSFSYPTLG